MLAVPLRPHTPEVMLASDFVNVHWDAPNYTTGPTNCTVIVVDASEANKKYYKVDKGAL